MIEGWLMSYVSSVLRQIFGFSTIWEAWNELYQYFFSKSKSIIIQLRKELMNVKNFGMCISDYTLKLKELIDQLEYDDYAITEEDTIMYLIAGLDRKYESVVLTLLACMQNELISL